MNKNFCVVTTVNPPTKAIEVLHEKFGSNLIVVGDVKTPTDWNYKDATYIPIDRVDNKEWHEGYNPLNHYARKNVGYMEAVKRGAEVIYESDDDNVPNENWLLRENQVESFESLSKGWYNVYRNFTNEFIWARGFSLKNINKDALCWTNIQKNNSSIQQGLADIEPDVDAIWRLLFNEKINFTNKTSVCLMPNTWCPFNSQSTWFFRKAFPLMYLPCYATMRMTDIYRSYVAQKCLWELGEGVTFHSPSEVYQDRNEHDLLKDFEEEVHGYLNVDCIVETLQSLELKSGEENICHNMLTCYQAIVDKGILPEMEIRSLKKWIKDYEQITN